MPSDVFLGISTSGESPDIHDAIRQCHERGVKTIEFTGYQDGKAMALADFCTIAPECRTSVIQELHIVLAHSLCQCVEIEFISHPLAESRS